MGTILEQLDNGTQEKLSVFWAKFYADNPDFGHNPRATERTEEKTIYRSFVNGDGEASRYSYDGRDCAPEDGWKHFDTDQDAHYFGVWYHMDRRVTVTYAEGDETIVVCHTAEAWKTQLEEMAEFYGDPPWAFKTLDVVDGVLEIVEYIDQDARPEVA